MTSLDEQTIKEWALRQSEPTSILMARGGHGPADERLSVFCNRFKELVPQIQIRKAPDESFRVPALIIGRHSNIAFQAVPEGKELPPFLEALSAAATKDADGGSADGALCLDIPAELTLYVAMQCPFCPEAVRELTAMALRAALLRIAVVDGVLFDQQAKAHGIRSAPTLILDDQLRWTGRIDFREVASQLVRRDPARLSPASLRQMLEAGDAPRAAALMIERDRIFPALIELLAHERWPVRLGAMVVVEYIACDAPALAERLIAPLWERFNALTEPVQGDLVHVLGQVACGAAKERLRQIAGGDFAESVKEAAAEELDPAKPV